MNYAGYSAKTNPTGEEGIILQEIKENNEKWKFQFSFNNKVLIKRFAFSEVTIIEKIKDELLLERLIRDINSNDSNTELWSSQILVYFIEEYGSDIDTNKLKNSIIEMLKKLSRINEQTVENLLSEGIYEFLILENIDCQTKQKIIIELARLNKDCLYDLLNDEEYLLFHEVKEFVERKRNEYNTSR